MSTDIDWMHHALTLAKHAQTQGEVPVGAVLVYENQIIGSGWNQPISTNDPTAHAEIIALREAAKTLKNYRLIDTTLYVTLEPCAMCAGAIINARVKHVVFGCHDPRAGAAESIFQLLNNPNLNHRTTFVGGILSDKCRLLLKTFFQDRRN